MMFQDGILRVTVGIGYILKRSPSRFPQRFLGALKKRVAYIAEWLCTLFLFFLIKPDSVKTLPILRYIF